MLPERAAIAFQRCSGPLARAAYAPVGLDAYHGAELAAVEAAVPAPDKPAWNRRREQNTLRAGMWAFNGVPWEPDRSLDHCEWDVLWRLTFGGLSAETRARIDDPQHGFAWRGCRVERAAATAIRDVLPARTVRTTAQPSPELRPPDHAARCAEQGTTVEGWRRADIAAELVTGEVVTLDVRTVHLGRASALRTKVDAQLRAIENEKRRKYSAYYRRFWPLVISVTGAVSEVGWSALGEIARLASTIFIDYIQTIKSSTQELSPSNHSFPYLDRYRSSPPSSSPPSSSPSSDSEPPSDPQLAHHGTATSFKCYAKVR